MISRITPTKRPRADAGGSPAADGERGGHAAPSGRVGPGPRTRAAGLAAASAGFTLLELLLALGLMAMMAGMVLLNVDMLRGDRALDEGVLRMETALRMARADAANQGRRFRLAFSEADGKIRVLWEPDPLAEPGQFAEYTACTWDDYLASENVRVDRWELIGPSFYQLPDIGTGETFGNRTDAAVAITFEPDGSSDSAVIEIVATDGFDVRRGVIAIEGMTGVITSRILSSEEAAAL